MRPLISLGTISGLGVLALMLCSCDDKKAPPAAPSATAAPVVPPPAPPPPAPPPPEEKKRPEKIETSVTPERRQKVEAAIPEAKGFVVAAEVEDGLKKKKLDKEAPALAGFEAKAHGKWVLFVGPIGNMTPTSFDLPVTYTAQAEGDPFGMSRKWIAVTFSDVKGYDPSKFKGGGQMVVVLAKYNGKKKASPGYELVDLGDW